MRDDQRPHPPPAAVGQYEDRAHDHVADEAADALVEVVRAAQHRARDQRTHWGPAQPVEPAQQVGQHDDLLHHGVLHRGEDQHGELPPHVRQRLRHHREVEPARPGRQVERQPRAPDPGRDQGAARQVPAGPGAVEAQHPQPRLALAGEQVGDQQHRHERGADPEQLPGQVQPGPAGGVRAVEGGGLVLEPAGPVSYTRTRRRPSSCNDSTIGSGCARTSDSRSALCVPTTPVCPSPAQRDHRPVAGTRRPRAPGAARFRAAGPVGGPQPPLPPGRRARCGRGRPCASARCTAG